MTEVELPLNMSSRTLQTVYEFVVFLDSEFGSSLSFTTAPIWQRLTFVTFRPTESEEGADNRLKKDVYFAVEASLEFAKARLSERRLHAATVAPSPILEDFDDRLKHFCTVMEEFASLRVSQVLEFDMDTAFSAVRECVAVLPGETALATQRQKPNEISTSRPALSWEKVLTVQGAAVLGGLVLTLIAFFLLPLLGAKSVWLRLAIVLLPASLFPFVLIWLRVWTWYRRMAISTLALYLGSFAISKITFFFSDGPQTELGVIVDHIGDSPITLVCVTILVVLFTVLDFLDRRKAE